jgi:hypothetical protein
MDAFFRLVFGPYAPLARHEFHSTTTFLFILLCIYSVKNATEFMFPPNQYVAIAIHVVDNYAGLLGIIGFLVWTTLDIVLLVRERWNRETEDHGEAPQ